MNSLSKKIAFLMLGLITLSLGHLAHSYPYQYRKLTKILDNGELSIIDLISDYHTLTQQNSRTSEADTLLNTYEQNNFSICEQALLSALRELKNGQEQFDLLWETHTGENITATSKYFQRILLAHGQTLKPEFAHSQVNFVSADEYRKNNDSKLNFKLLYAVLKDKKSPINKDFSIIKQTQNPALYHQLKTMWKFGFKKQLRLFYNQCLQLTAQPQNIDKKYAQEFLAKFFNLFIEQIADYNFLIKIFATPQQRKIIYAGGAHCDNVCKMLIKQFGYSQVINIGTPSELNQAFFKLMPPEVSKSSLATPLLPSVWNFLQESTQKTRNRITKNGLIISPYSGNDGGYLFDPTNNKKIEKKIRTCIASKNRSYCSMSAFEKKSLLSEALSQDSVPAIKLLVTGKDEISKTCAELGLYMAIEEHKNKIVTFILQNKLVDNLNQEVDEEKQSYLHTAYLQNNQVAQKLLIEHGADQYKKDIHGKIPSDYKPLWRTVEKVKNIAKNKIADSVAYIGNWALQYKLVKGLSDIVQYGQGNTVTR